MALAGYSGTPLLKKLGITNEMKVLLLHAPTDFCVWLDKDLQPQLSTQKQIPDYIHLFADNIKTFEAGMKRILPLSGKNKNVIIWVSWYKKTSGITTDLNEDIIRAFALSHQLVDIKVCAVTEQWSALKLVVPKSLR